MVNLRLPFSAIACLSLLYAEISFAAEIMTEAQTPLQESHCIPIRHAAGETCVPDQVKKLVVLDTGELDISISLGYIPSATTYPYQKKDLPDYIDTAQKTGTTQTTDRTQKTDTAQIADTKIISIGLNSQPDLERILEIQPDLILGSQWVHGQLYPTLSQIAPTVLSEKVGVSWQENVRLFAQALQQEARAEQILQQHVRRCQRINQQYQLKGSPTVSVVRSMQDHVRLYLQDTFVHSLLALCGIQRPDIQDKPGFAIRLRSPAQIQQLAGGIILLSEYSPRQGSLIRQWQKTRFWSLLDSPVVAIDDNHWMLGIGPLAANKVLQDLEEILQSYEPET